jgi:hypothetical protein
MRYTYCIDHKFTTNVLQKLEDFRNNMNIKATSQSVHRVPPVSLDLMEDELTDALASSAVDPMPRQIPTVTEQTNDILIQELTQNLPTVPEDEPESRIAVLEL